MAGSPWWGISLAARCGIEGVVSSDTYSCDPSGSSALGRGPCVAPFRVRRVDTDPVGPGSAPSTPSDTPR